MRKWPRPTRFSKHDQDAMLRLFESGPPAAIAAYLEAETAKIRATWDEHEERHRRDGREEHVEIRQFQTIQTRRIAGSSEY